MPCSFRADPELDAVLRRIATERGWSKSQVVREAVAHYGREPESAARSVRSRSPSALDRLRPYLGIVDTRGAQLSRNTHARYRARLRRKHRERRTR
jgi:ribbon-helix-helix CopG family protein